MTKRDLIKTVAINSNIDENIVSSVLEEAFRTLQAFFRNAKPEERITIPQFGKFIVIERKERNKETLRKDVKFKPFLD